MRIRRYSDVNVFQAILDKVKAAWARFKGTLSKLPWGRKIAFVFGKLIQLMSAIKNTYDAARMYSVIRSLNKLKDVVKEIRDSDPYNKTVLSSAEELRANIAESKNVAFKTYVTNFVLNLISFATGVLVEKLADTTKKHDSRYGMRRVDTYALVEYALRSIR